MRNEEKTYRIFFIIRGYKIYKIGLAPNPPYRKNNFRLCYKEFEIDPKVFDPEDDDAYHKLAMQFFSEITSQALAASKPETGAEELENTRSQLTEWIDHVKDAPHQEPVKNYFQFLLPMSIKMITKLSSKT